MELIARAFSRKCQLGCYLLVVSAMSYNAFATTYTYPGNATPPLSMTNNDALTVTSGTMQTPSSSSTPYTVDFSNASTNPVNITVNSGATISYQGTNGGAASINSARNDSNTTSDTIGINGAVSSGTGLYAISLKNAAGSPGDSYTINLGTAASISGAILTTNVKSVILNIAGNAQIAGTINLGTTTSSSMQVGSGGSAVFTPTQSIDNISALSLLNNSTMNLNVNNINIKAVTINAGSTLNVNYALNGLTTSDGAISNAGTINIAANINKTGTFTGTGSNVVTAGAAAGLSIATSSYNITNHTAALNDVLNYGNINLTNGSGSVAFTATNFAVTNGGGYFPGGTYTLVTSEAAPVVTNFLTPPASSLFLSFATPVINSHEIQITLTRTPFTTFAMTNLTQSIAGNLETIGANNPSASMVTLLDAVEASTSANQVEYALRQLAPLANAPFYGYEVQNDTMYQVQLRLAALHNNQTSYFAGDIAKDNNVWLRPFGSYGNQQAKEDSLGYYATSGGIVAGFDRNLDDNYTVGAAFAYALSHVKDKVNPQSITDLKSYIGMVYGTYNFSRTEYLDWIIALTANNFNANRLVDINNEYIQTAKSSYGSQQVSVRGIWGKNYPAFDFMQLTPEALAQYTFSKQYTYSESGAPGANLTISRTNSDVVTLGLGGKAAVPILVNPSIVMPEIHGWVYYNPIAGKQNTIFNFIDGGGTMTSIMNLSRTGLFLGAAITIAVVDRLEVKLNFDYNIEDRYNGYIGYLNLRYTL